MRIESLMAAKSCKEMYGISTKIQNTTTTSHNRRFYGRGRHLVGRAKNSDGLGRVIASVQMAGKEYKFEDFLHLTATSLQDFALFASSQ